MVRIRFVSLIRLVSFVGVCAFVGQTLAADPAATTLYSTDGLQGTKSVMVRHTGAAAADPSASPVRMVDKAVQPASANEPLGALAAADSGKAGDGVDTATAAASLAASDLLGHALEPAKTSPLAGHTLTLLQAITPFAGNRNFQLAIARAYWKLAASQGDYNWAVDESDRLDQVATGTAATDSTVMATARASSQARLLEAKLAAVTAQQELADLLSIPPNNPLPLAADPPLVGAYRTYFETLYAGRVPPPRMRLIDRTLPIRREAIETHVAAVQAAASAVHSAEDARAKGQSDLQNLLLCEADLSRQRRSFLAAVRDYNFDIDEYALTVAEPNVPTDRVIGMLIRTRPAASPTIAPPPAAAAVPPASSEPTIVRPAPTDPLLQPALPPGTRPAPAAASTDAGAATPPASPNVSPTPPASSPPPVAPTAPTTPTTPPSTPPPPPSAPATPPTSTDSTPPPPNPFAPAAPKGK